jgi:hypothetical protein
MMPFGPRFVRVWFTAESLPKTKQPELKTAFEPTTMPNTTV